MTAGVAAFVGLGVAGALLLGLGVGLDRGAYVLLAVIIALGLLAVAVTRRSQIGVVRPRRCPACGGLIARSATYCKHCGETL